MAKNARDTGPEKPPATDEAHLSARLRRLGDELGREQARDAGNIDRGPTAGDPSAFARGFRLSTELIAGVLVGAVIGFGLDRLLGNSRPRAYATTGTPTASASRTEMESPS